MTAQTGRRAIVAEPSDQPHPLASRIYKVYFASRWYDWDPAKSQRTFIEREIDFAFATLIFDGPVVVRADGRRDYGEMRLVATGLADGEMLTVVYTDRENAGEVVVRRIISARKANKHERQAYQATHPRLYAETEPGPR
jgi:uncharacterized protein